MGSDSKTGGLDRDQAEDGKQARQADATEAGATEAAAEQAARRPVRSSSKAGAAGPNRVRSGKANKGNRSSRQEREKGANKKEDADSDKDEEEEEEKKRDATEDFWRYIVTASYSSRKARGDWGGTDPGE